jgi:hypothetical protein
LLLLVGYTCCIHETITFNDNERDQSGAKVTNTAV